MSGDIPFVSLTRITHEHNYQEKKTFLHLLFANKIVKIIPDYYFCNNHSKP